MKRSPGLPALAVLALGAGCDGLSDIVSPGPGNETLRIFERPFAAQYFNGWPFDHDLPLGVFSGVGVEDGSDDVLTWRGDIVALIWGNGKRHDGHDWAVPEGTPLLAVADGEVVTAGLEPPFVCGSRGEVSALIVRLRHETGSGEPIESLYKHLSRVDVTAGQRVRAGQVLGLSGQTGCASGPHLHFSVFRSGPDGRMVVVDPFGWEGSFPDPWERYSGVRSVWLWKNGHAPAGDYTP